jgi:peptidyl-prolyl cis-trans isomerase A (cyclophilin A)
MNKAVLVLAAFALFSVPALSQKKEKTKLSKMDKEFLEKQPEGVYAKLETNRGDIYVALDYKLAPMTVANFVGLAEGSIKNTAKPEGTPYYDGLIFHRVISGFMIQGGCPQGTGMGDPGYKFADEYDANNELGKRGYRRGVMAMANAGPNTNGSQFFIMHQDYGLPLNYTPFGMTVKGIEVVDSIAATPKDRGDRPSQDQVIKHVSILRKGKDAEAFNAAKVFEFEKSNIVKKKEDAAKAEILATEAIIKEKYGNSVASGSGLRYIIEKPGEGAGINTGDNVVLHCTGTLLNGTKFWSSYDGAGQPLTISMGVSPRLIPGMEEGIMLLKQGGKGKFIIPPQLGYGEAGQPPAIPPRSWLVFDVEVVKVGK